jgi:hypothetical protein
MHRLVPGHIFLLYTTTSCAKMMGLMLPFPFFILNAFHVCALYMFNKIGASTVPYCSSSSILRGISVESPFTVIDMVLSCNIFLSSMVQLLGRPFAISLRNSLLIYMMSKSFLRSIRHVPVNRLVKNFEVFVYAIRVNLLITVNYIGLGSGSLKDSQRLVSISVFHHLVQPLHTGYSARQTKYGGRGKTKECTTVAPTLDAETTDHYQHDIYLNNYVGR